MAEQKPPRKRTGAYQHGEFLGGPGDEAPTEPEETQHRQTGAYQDGERLGGPADPDDTVQVEPPAVTPPTTPSTSKKGRHRRT